MTSLSQSTNQQGLSDQSLSAESIVDEVQSPTNISNSGNINNNSRNNDAQQPLPPNNAAPQPVQTGDEHDQIGENLIEDQPQPTENGFVRCAKSVGMGIYKAMYCAGGFLADLFGITTPRYAYELHEYQRIQERNRQRELERENEANGETTGDLESPINLQEPNHAL